MKIIPPYQISSEILNLINQAEKYIVLVSPYVDFKSWGGIKQEIINATCGFINMLLNFKEEVYQRKKEAN